MSIENERDYLNAMDLIDSMETDDETRRKMKLMSKTEMVNMYKEAKKITDEMFKFN